MVPLAPYLDMEVRDGHGTAQGSAAPVKVSYYSKIVYNGPLLEPC